MEYECWLKNEREKNSYESTGFSKGKTEGIAEGMAKCMAKGIAKGIAKGKLEAVINLIQEMNWSLEKTMSVLKMDDAYKDEIKKQLKNMQNNN